MRPHVFPPDHYIKENGRLRTVIEKLEKENRQLKHSVYELSLHMDAIRTTNQTFQYPNPSLTQHNIIPHDKEKHNINNMDNHRINLSNHESSKNTLSTLNTDTIFTHQTELLGHTGAIYALEFSKCGKFIVSGSWDKSAILWETSSFSKKSSFAEHSELICDVSWNKISSHYITGSYDHTVRVVDVEKSAGVSIQRLDGFVQCCVYSPDETEVYFAGTSQKMIYCLDTRTTTTTNWKHTSLVNTMYVTDGGRHIVTGDSMGRILTWDIRLGSVIESLTKVNDEGQHPISHLHALPMSVGKMERVAVNSYDNLLRVYDRSPQGMHLQHILTGHRNKNWPIKSSFFCGTGRLFQLPTSLTRRRAYPESDEQDGTPNLDAASEPQDARTMNLRKETMLLATGSADHSVYVFNLNNKKQSLLQKLDGHTDRVYAAVFHPKEPLLASASADCTVKVWAPRTSAPTSPAGWEQEQK